VDLFDNIEKPKVLLTQLVIRDDNGNLVTGKPRPYQIEIRVSGLCFTTPWYFEVDEKSEHRARDVARSIGGAFESPPRSER